MRRFLPAALVALAACSTSTTATVPDAAPPDAAPPDAAPPDAVTDAVTDAATDEAAPEAAWVDAAQDADVAPNGDAGSGIVWPHLGPCDGRVDRPRADANQRDALLRACFTPVVLHPGDVFCSNTCDGYVSTRGNGGGCPPAGTPALVLVIDPAGGTAAVRVTQGFELTSPGACGSSGPCLGSGPITVREIGLYGVLDPEGCGPFAIAVVAGAAPPPGTDAGASVPVNHRASDGACRSPRPAGSCAPGHAGLGATCAADADCTAGVNGRCDNAGDVGGAACRCTYDLCRGDADCATGQTCLCRFGQMGANQCVPGSCRVDGDCGPGGRCSPSPQDNWSGATTGYHCHTPGDTCGNDVDCPLPCAVAHVCSFSDTAGLWQCTTGCPD